MRQAALKSIYDMAIRDPRVVFVGSDLGEGVLDQMKAAMPMRFFMEGVSEQYLIGMAAGLAMDGYIPFVNTIATFLTRRCYDQIAIDLCLHNLPVRLLANGGGTTYAPLGPTHMTIEDISIMRSLPNMTVVAPADAPEMRRVIEASLDWPSPMYIRVAKGGDPIVTAEQTSFALGCAIPLREPGTVLFLSTGIMTSRALQACNELERSGISSGVLHIHTIKPLDEEAIIEHSKDAELVVTLEEHSLIGGLGSAVAELVADRNLRRRLLRLALPDAFPHGYGSQDYLLSLAKLDVPGILAHVRKQLSMRGVA